MWISVGVQTLEQLEDPNPTPSARRPLHGDWGNVDRRKVARPARWSHWAGQGTQRLASSNYSPCMPLPRIRPKRRWSAGYRRNNEASLKHKPRCGRNYGAGIMALELWRWNYGAGIMVDVTPIVPRARW